MNFLFVTPSNVSTGEAATSASCAERLQRAGHSIHFLASPFVADKLPVALPVTRLTPDYATNLAEWHATLADVKPDAVWFADFDMNFFQRAQRGMLGTDAWLKSLDSVDADLLTFDHFGIDQRARQLTYGRWPHVITEDIPELPARMRRMLPCPIHEPGDVNGRDGTPFRYWEPLELTDDDIESTKRQLAGDGLLIAHFVPAWAERVARMIEHPYYDNLAAWLQTTFEPLQVPVTVLSINESGLLKPPTTPSTVRILNGLAPSYEFCERLIYASDLVLSENAISVMVGKAICSGTPAAILRADDFDVFPLWDADAMQQFGIFTDNSYADALYTFDVGQDHDAETQEALRDLLTDASERAVCNELQADYAIKVDALPWVEELF